MKELGVLSNEVYVLKDFVSFDKLPGEEQEKLIKKQVNKTLLEMIEISEEQAKLLLPADVFEELIKCDKEMEELQTPWFIGKRLLESPTVKNFVEGAARKQLEELLFHSKSGFSVPKCYTEGEKVVNE
jgi:5-formaminoimidazole-4-carboxamide-1-beta-D-ribofuranosyl 5'-monophosphate synthetase